MKLSIVIDGAQCQLLQGNADIQIGDICIDSRKASPGCLFVAVPGATVDGHDYIGQAIAAGAIAVIVQHEMQLEAQLGAQPGVQLGVPHQASEQVTILAVPDTRAILSLLVNKFHGNPSEKFKLIGVTGTNGKTSVAFLIDRILQSLGQRTGLIGTLGDFCRGQEMDTARTTPTTPDCIELGQIMASMVEAEVNSVVMEVSSMGLKTGRVDCLDFDISVFTNLSPEHLDDHKTMEDYTASKLLLFSMASCAVVNIDDGLGKVVAQTAEEANRAVLTYGIKNPEPTDLFARDIDYQINGVSFEMVFHHAKDDRADGGDLGNERNERNGRNDHNGRILPVDFAERIFLDTPSEFAVYNALAAAGACLSLGLDAEAIVQALNSHIAIPGRYQILNGAGITAIVDYAHTAGALENLLLAVKANPSYNRVVSVFGCGGDRDPSKRAPMGEISGRLADYSIITSDNPRTEEPLAIIAQIESGISKTAGCYEIEADRPAAINKAIALARPGDVVVIAGKGHEDYQIIGHTKIHMDDREIAQAAIDNL